MEFDQLVDELEASFAQQNFDWKQNINLLTIQTIEGHFVDLLAPIIGLDFVAGLDRLVHRHHVGHPARRQQRPDRGIDCAVFRMVEVQIGRAHV